MTESNQHPLSPEKLAAELADQAVSAQEVAPSGEPDAVSPAGAFGRASTGARSTTGTGTSAAGTAAAGPPARSVTVMPSEYSPA